MGTVSQLLQPEYFSRPQNLKTWLARALNQGKLRLVLGAGVSQEIGLPSWSDLVARLERHCQKTFAGNDDTEKSEAILRNGFYRDRIKFAEAVRKCLYEGYDSTLAGLSTRRLMIALSALAIPGRRGSVREIVTFNFDDLLEEYLGYLGFHVQSTALLPRWSGLHDIEILHVHGVLFSNPQKPIDRGVVFTESDFDEIVGDARNLWHKKVIDILQSNFCIFIGLSGDDPNLRNILVKTKKEHVSSEESLFWGIRFSSDENDRRKGTFEDNGIFQVTVPHAEIPDWLFDVIQAAGDPQPL